MKFKSGDLEIIEKTVQDASDWLNKKRLAGNGEFLAERKELADIMNLVTKEEYPGGDGEDLAAQVTMITKTEDLCKFATVANGDEETDQMVTDASGVGEDRTIIVLWSKKLEHELEGVEVTTEKVVAEKIEQAS